MEDNFTLAQRDAQSALKGVAAGQADAQHPFAVSSPTLGDYIKALAALAAETTASVGDALGETADDDSQNVTDEGQDEALGTSAAVGATIGVVVGATVGVN
ncbi:hypothetical protein AK812_SmicGene30012 [Symbiodinium microadriaticum]|uniref:Uncharacterized protein n=1 Tax=Symbiodinium microadriaticum TaxID=2951 RepID=A0A1Q9D0C6_SYMMI|nr:hypothetical protein AK812_SmicGene30012 [Symbiodinium microadriaticum]